MQIYLFQVDLNSILLEVSASSVQPADSQLVTNKRLIDEGYNIINERLRLIAVYRDLKAAQEFEAQAEKELDLFIENGVQ